MIMIQTRELLDDINSRIMGLEGWKWHGQPGFTLTEKKVRHEKSIAVPFALDIMIGRLILNATAEDCLTAPSEYVRECKRWFLTHKEEDWEMLFKYGF